MALTWSRPGQADGERIQRERAQQIAPHALLHLVQAADSGFNPGHIDGLRDAGQLGRQVDVTHQVARSRMQQQQIFEQTGEGMQQGAGLLLPLGARAVGLGYAEERSVVGLLARASPVAFESITSASWRLAR